MHSERRDGNDRLKEKGGNRDWKKNNLKKKGGPRGKGGGGRLQCRRIRGLVSGGRDEQKPERHMLQLATRCPTRPFPLFCGQKKRAGNVAGPALTHQNCMYMCRRTCEEVSLGGGMGVALPGTRYLDIAVLGRVSVLAGSPPASTSDWREMEQKGMREMGGGERVILCVCVCHHPISLFLSLSLTHHDRPSFQCCC